MKVGLELFGAEGPGVLHALGERDKSVFLDLKLHHVGHALTHPQEVPFHIIDGISA